MEMTDVRGRLDSRTNSLLLFRRLFEAELDSQTLGAIEQTKAAKVFTSCSDSKAIAEVVDRLSQPITDDAIEKMRVEYTRMFVGPGHLIAPFWESVYLDDRELLFLESTSAVRRAYEEEGLKVEAKSGREAEDSLPHELDFLAHLSARTAEALDNGNEDEATRLISVQHSFEKNHMSDWLPAFAERALACESDMLYPSLCAAVRDFIEDDIAFLERILDN